MAEVPEKICTVLSIEHFPGPNTCFHHKNFQKLSFFCLYTVMGLGDVDAPTLWEASLLGRSALAPSGDSGKQQTRKEKLPFHL